MHATGATVSTLPAPIRRDHSDPLARHARLVAALRSPERWKGVPVAVFETHISSVLVVGSDAYKFKKPVALSFVDFSTLAARRHYCAEELRLNRRLAPALYLDVVSVTGTPDHPVIGGAGPPIDYAVHMRAFDQDSLASRALARGALAATHIDALAATVARFHATTAAAAPDSPFGTPDEVRKQALANCTELLALQDEPSDRADIEAVRDWIVRRHAALHATFARRHAEGFVRECHGDLHLGNIVLQDEVPCVFDCIEFNDRLRWIDVMSEVAFTAMDLEDRGRKDLAYRFVNAYLEHTGDYPGVAVLPFYLVYRAMVRAKVAGLRAQQLATGPGRRAVLVECREYLAMARRFGEMHRPALLVTQGLAGSGKSKNTQALLEAAGAVRIRTDVERKRLFGLARDARSHSGVRSGLYTDDATRATYARASELARPVLASGHLAIVDGTFLKAWQRACFRALAAELGVPFAIATFEAPVAVLEARVAARAARPGEVSEAGPAVLAHQLREHEPLAGDECAAVVRFDTGGPAAASSPGRWNELLGRLSQERLVTPLDPPFAGRVAFLGRTDSYPAPTAAVTAVETHMSWVFLTDAHAWKLKKPVRNGLLDLTQPEARRVHADEELRLNRRLAPDVYLGIETLRRRSDGGLSLHEPGEVVDWLVLMRRLPAEAMLDQRIARGNVSDRELRMLVHALCAFYATSPRGDVMPKAHRERFVRAIDDNAGELAVPAWGLPPARVESIATRQRATLEALGDVLEGRAAAGHIVEAHGDLRPEHIAMTWPPAIIDCLEFSRVLRLMDAADEIAFLALECERLGAAGHAATIVKSYRELANDPAPVALMHFYAGIHAVTRAKLAVWHLRDPALRDARWRTAAMNYLALAERHLVA